MSVDSILLAPVVGLLVWFFQHRIQAIRDERRRLQDERRALYVKALEPLIRAMTGLKNPAEAKKALEQMTSFEHRRVLNELTFVGSDEVVHAYNSMMQTVYAQAESPDPIAVLDKLGGLMLAVRRDLGAKHTKLKAPDMLAAQISDIKKHLPPG